jgi:hypothetical protein
MKSAGLKRSKEKERACRQAPRQQKPWGEGGWGGVKHQEVMTLGCRIPTFFSKTVKTGKAGEREKERERESKKGEEAGRIKEMAWIGGTKTG